MPYHIFCDESRQSAERFMVLGGIVIPDINVFTVNETMKQFRVQTKMHAELKWAKVSNQKLEEYKTFVDYFFALNNANRAHFHCIVFDNHQINHAKYSGGDKEKGFYKFYYQLLLNCFAKHYKGQRFIVHLDERTSSYPLGDLKRILNNGVGKKFQDYTSPFVSIEPQNSKLSEVMQLNDLILGAVGYHKNALHLIPGGKKCKKDLSAYIAKKSGVEILGENTRYGQVRFKVWNFRLSPRK